MSLGAVRQFAKVAIGTPDLSKTTISNFSSAGVLTNPGVTFFGAALSVGMAKAAVNIGPPAVVPGVSLPMSLWVDGISQFNGIVNIYGAINQFSLETSFGAKIANSLGLKNGVDVKNALNVGNAVTNLNGALFVAGTVTAPIFVGDISATTGVNGPTAAAIAASKGFDIPHVTKSGKRIRHICVEGPESAIYIRGRLKNGDVIKLPEYWDGLVDYDSISVQLQPIGDRHFHLNVSDIDKEKIVVKEADDKPFECFYHVWVARWIDSKNHNEELHVVYDGESPKDYPGNPESFSIAGWDYDRR